MIEYILFPLIAYLLGSIPTAVWVGKLKHGTDVREHGSKNAGATNTFRVLGKKPGIVVLSIDVLKGFVAVVLPFLLGIGEIGVEKWTNIQLIAALAVVFGHVFPVFAKFNGGKGVATSLGVIIGVHPPAAGICVLLFFIVFLISKFVSLGAITASIAFPLLLIFVFKVNSIWLMVFAVFLGSAVIISHRKNIMRLLKGNENKMNLFKK